MRNQELDLEILMGPFQFEMLYDSMNWWGHNLELFVLLKGNTWSRCKESNSSSCPRLIADGYFLGEGEEHCSDTLLPL